MSRLVDHPARYVLAAEVHARLPAELAAPCRASYIAVLVAADDRDAELAHIERLCERYGVSPPQPGATHFSASLDALRFKWERHGEFSGYTCFVSGLKPPAYSEPAVSLLPHGWVDDIPGQRVVAAHTRYLSDLKLDDSVSIEEHFEGNTPVGGRIAEGVGIALTDFKIHRDGYSRFVLVDNGMSAGQAGRMVQRLFEIEAYRMLALLGLPLARTLSPQVAALEQRLMAVTDAIGGNKEVTVTSDERLLAELTRLAAEVERALAGSQYRFGASRAYYELVRTRIAELREQRLAGVQTIDEFMTRRLAPALATCNTVSQRLRDLSDRIAQTSGLLATRVGIAREKQNQALLASMEQRAGMQLRLQQAVEGLSVAAICYYMVSLLSLGFSALEEMGVKLNATLATGIAIPVVLVIVTMSLRFVRRKVIRRGRQESDEHGM